MVEIGINPIQAQPQQSQQNSAQQQASNSAPVSVNNAPDSVIVATANSHGANVRGEDAFRRPHGGEQRGGIPSVSELSAGIDTRVAFDSNQSGRVVLEITSSNGQAIARIPSESLVEYLETQFKQQNNIANLDLEAKSDS